jgi:predicted N-acyltransferase
MMLQNLKAKPADDLVEIDQHHLKVEVHESLSTIERSAWNACFVGNLEGYDYLLAVENGGLDDFHWRYVTVEQDGMIVAAMPAFLCDYGLETTLPRGRLHTMIGWVRTIAPRFLKLKLACLGSPCTENGAVGFNPAVPPRHRGTILAKLLAGFEATAAAEGCTLVALKDMPLPLEPALSQLLKRRGYVDTGGMPTAWRDIDFQTIDDYLATLSSGTRKDMRRKLRAASAVTVERVSDLGPWHARFMELYHQTRERSEWQFEDLTPTYFSGILHHMPENAFCTVYTAKGEILAFNLLLHDDGQLIDKFFCMDAERGRPYNLYYLSWFENLRYCLENGIERYQSGQAYYRNKVKLGSELTENAMFFRHTNRIAHAVLKRIAPFLAGDDGKDIAP